MMRLMVDVRYYRTYTCSGCGKIQRGSMQMLNDEYPNTDALKIALDNIDKSKPLAYYMPFDWVYNGEFFCPNCIKRR